MAFPRVRTILSLGLLGWMAVFVPLGCSAKIVYPLYDDRPRVPDATAERLRTCVDEVGGDLPRGYDTFDYEVQVDQEGRVVDVKTKDMPNADLAICTRIALRGMTVPKDLLALGELRRSKSLAPANEQTMPERALFGNIVVLGMTIVLADLIIEAGGITIVIAITVAIAKDVVEAIREKDDAEEEDPCQTHLKACLNKALADKPGSVKGETRCAQCYDRCRGQNEWPDKIELIRGHASCKYWLRNWPR